MLNMSKVNNERLRRLEFFVNTNNVDYKSKKGLVLIASLAILKGFYKSTFRIIIEIIKYSIVNLIEDIKFRLKIQYYRYILKLNEDQIDDKLAGN